MTTNAIAGVGTEFKLGSSDSSGTVFTTVAEINGITGPSLSKATIDVTSFDSVGGYREFIGSFRDSGECSLEMNFTRDQYILMKEAFDADANYYCQIVFPDGGQTTLDFAALITGLGVAVPLDDKITQNVNLKVTGKVEISS